MRIGVDATSWQNSRGYGRYTRGLLSAVARLDGGHDYVLFFDELPPHDVLPPGVEVRVVAADRPTAQAAAAGSRRGLRDMWRTGRALAGRDLDLLLFPTVYSFVPVISGAAKIVFIHDTIPEDYPELAIPDRKSRIFWRVKSAIARRQADAIVTVSEYSRRRIASQFGIPIEKIFVAGEAADPVFRKLERPLDASVLERLGLGPDRRFVAYVGGFSPHKNVGGLVEAYGRLTRRAPGFEDVDLVLVGEYEREVFHTDYPRLRRRVDELGLADRVLFTGFVADPDLVVLLNAAQALALPSLVEGYGLPAIEAAACGCPVVATRESPLPELLADGGIFVDPTDGEALTGAIARVVGSEKRRREMGQAGLEAAARYSWEHSGRQLLAVIDQVAA